MAHGEKLPDIGSAGPDEGVEETAGAERGSPPASGSAPAVTTSKPARKGPSPAHPNNVRKLRIERMLSKAELARRANLSVLTIDRVEKGFGCRMNTKRKILEALGLSLADRVMVFGEEE
ncbi:MAG: helix-turn-helix transcriptional regulator [Myxococcota bacterium]